MRLEHPRVEADTGPDGDDLLALLLGAVFAAESRARSEAKVLGFAPSGWRNLRTQGQRQEWEHSNTLTQTELLLGPAGAEVLVGPWPIADEQGALLEDSRRRMTVRALDRRAGYQSLEIDGVRTRVETIIEGHSVHCRSSAGVSSFALVPRFAIHTGPTASHGPVSPLPGAVIAVHVSIGDEVVAGQTLMVVEAMKMEHQIRSATAGIVAEILAGVGARVAQGDLLVEVTP